MILTQCQTLSWWSWGAQGQPVRAEEPPGHGLLGGYCLMGGDGAAARLTGPLSYQPGQLVPKQGSTRMVTADPQPSVHTALPPAAAASCRPSGGPQAEPQETCPCAHTIRGPFMFL